MVRSSSINADLTKTAGLMGANACVALSGAMIAHYNCYAEVRMGIGMVVIGLASFIIGEIAVGIFVKRKGVLSGVVSGGSRLDFIPPDHRTGAGTELFFLQLKAHYRYHCCSCNVLSGNL